MKNLYKEKPAVERWKERQADNAAWHTIWSRLFYACQIGGWILVLSDSAIGREDSPGFIAWGFSFMFLIGIWVCIYREWKYQEERRRGNF